MTEKLFDRLAERLIASNEKMRGSIEAGFTQTAGAVRLQGARPRPLPGASQLLWGGSGRLVGWSAQATGGPVRIVLRDGRDTSADAIAVVDLADSEHDNFAFAAGGISFGEALYLERTGSGTLTGAVHLGAVD